MNEHTSQGLSKRLHDAGFRGEHRSLYGNRGNLIEGICNKSDDPNYGWPAYTFTELWGVLPLVIKHYDLRLEATRGIRDIPQSIASYTHCSNNNDVLHYERNESPAEAVGLLLEWLIDNEHVVKGGGE